MTGHPEPSAQEKDAVIALFAGQRYAEALPLAQDLTLRFPRHGFGWMALGALLNTLGRPADALAPLQTAAALSPADAAAHSNLGAVLKHLGHLAAAAASCRRALGLDPGHAEACFNLGNTLADAGRLPEAERSYSRALQIRPDYAEAHNNLGVAHKTAGSPQAAADCHRRAVAVRPDYAEGHYNLGIALRDLGRPRDSVKAYAHALALQPGFVEAYVNRGMSLNDLGRLIAALSSYRRALILRPDHAEAWNDFGIVLHDLGRHDEAERGYRRALQLNADYAEAYSNLLLLIQYAEGHARAAVFAEHLAYARRFEAPLKAGWRPHGQRRKAADKLRIGYVSADLRRHAVANFIEPVLAHHDHERFEIFCYYSYPSADDVTRRLAAYADHWREIGAIGDDAAADRIRDDGIDLLVDLAGHTANNRLRLFARKPAPVQATWLGYHCSTGLSAMDYRIADARTDPPGMGDEYYSETLYRLPETFACYLPATSAPAVGRLAAGVAETLTFGSFNNIAKITPGVQALWAKVLRAVPRSRLMLKTRALAEPSVRERMTDQFAALGVAAERLVFAPQDASYFEHLDRYNEIDIGLDTFPCNGGTTSYDALWMGVPVVTLAGDSFISRMGVSVLSCLGLTELIARSDEEFVAIVADLAADLDRLAALRRGLRQKMAASALVDGQRFTRHLEQAYQSMWQAFISR